MKKNPLSLFDSSGDLEATQKFVALAGRIRETKIVNSFTPERKAEILLETISMLRGWYGIQHLGVRRIAEECQGRFRGLPAKSIQPPQITYDAVAGSTRVTPIYAPGSNSGENFLTEEPGHDARRRNPTLYIYSLIYLDTGGKIICVRVYSEEKKISIEFPHEVRVSRANETEVAGMMKKHPLLLDCCLKQLTSSVEAARLRAVENARVADKAEHSLRTIWQLNRDRDLGVMVFLAVTGSFLLQETDARVSMFRRIAQKAGATTAERKERLTEILASLDRRLGLTSISALPEEETLAIINDPGLG